LAEDRASRAAKLPGRTFIQAYLLIGAAIVRMRQMRGRRQAGEWPSRGGAPIDLDQSRAGRGTDVRRHPPVQFVLRMRGRRLTRKRKAGLIRARGLHTAER